MSTNQSDVEAVVEGFFDHLAAAMDLSATTTAALRSRHEELLAANADRAIDEPAAHNLRMTLAVVSGYEVATRLIGPDQAYAAVHAAFTEPLADVVTSGTRAMLDHADDPFRTMVEIARAREEQDFGAGFTFAHPVDDDQRFHADVHRCHYHDVLAANGVPQLTPVLCAFDGNWIAAIDPDRHGFRFERATTIGLGGTHCPFHFERTRAPRTPAS